MTHDIDEENLDAIAQDVNDLLQMIKQLELRIIDLEKELDPGVTHIAPDGWYFDH